MTSEDSYLKDKGFYPSDFFDKLDGIRINGKEIEEFRSKLSSEKLKIFDESEGKNEEDRKIHKRIIVLIWSMSDEEVAEAFKHSGELTKFGLHKDIANFMNGVTLLMMDSNDPKEREKSQRYAKITNNVISEMIAEKNPHVAEAMKKEKLSTQDIK